MADAFPISGQIDPKAFPFLVMDLHRHGATGSLKVEGPSYQKALYFRGGRILFGSSNDPRDQLGSILIESGKITPEQLEDVNLKVGPGSPLAKVLSETGFVNQRELSEAARAKVERILSDLIAYTAGNFDFEDGVLPKGAVDLKLSTERVVLAAVRRVSDRNFVLRHLEGLDVVLAPTADMQPRLPEIQADAGGLPEQLDGRQSLKEAAARTRLDEFEAAKVACALLFLGMVQRSSAAEADDEPIFMASDDAPPMEAGHVVDPSFADAEEPMVVDADEPTLVDTPFFAPPASLPVDFQLSEPSAFAPAPEPGPGPEPDFAPEPQPEPELAPEPAWSPDPAPAEPAWSSSPEPIQPSSSWSPAPDESPTIQMAAPDADETVLERAPLSGFPDIPPSNAPAPRPSKDDLAALDALLNPPSDLSASEPVEPTADPRLRVAPPWTNQRGGRRSAPSRLPLFVGMGIAGALLLAAGTWWWFANKPTGAAPLPERSIAASAPPSAEPAATMTAGATSPVPVGTPEATPTTVAAAPTPSTTRTPLPATPAPAAPAGDHAALMRAGDFAGAARASATRVKAAPAGSASLQLLVACSTDTIEKAARSVASPELMVLPIDFKGRACYRLTWGLYPSTAAASAAMGTIPSYFRDGGTRGRAVPAAELVP